MSFDQPRICYQDARINENASYDNASYDNASYDAAARGRR